MGDIDYDDEDDLFVEIDDEEDYKKVKRKPIRRKVELRR